MTDKNNLIKAAINSRKNAYAPYSGYTVGAAVFGEDGKIYSGCNIENASYPAGICAERTAVFKAISEGNRKIKAIALSAARAGENLQNYPSPCGICRQVMSEFADEDMPVLLAINEEDYKEYTLAELLPLGFTSKDL